MKSLLCGLIAFLFVGCGHENLPTYPLMDATHSLAALAHRFGQVKSISGSGSLDLEQPDGQRIRLDLAAALSPPDQARLRAWKFGQAVFDLTIHADGVWLEARKTDRAIPPEVTANRIAQIWRLLGGSLFSDPHVVATVEANELRLVRRAGNEPELICLIDRETLTPRLYQLLDDKGLPRFSLKLDRYKIFNGLPWPTRLIAQSDTGRIIVEFREIDLNTDLPAGAFVPPRRAEKLP